MIPEGHRWHIFKQLVFRTYGDVCVVCGHGGARHVDHVISRTEWPEGAFELANCRPIHGAPGNPCPVCSARAGKNVHCNNIKSGMSLARAKRKVEEIVAGGQKTQKKPGSSSAADEDPGRVW
jgi:5-methylcytosine-specific restriction endonuclease McrA